MAVTLYLDVGNSACKWRLVSPGGRQQGSFYHQDGWSALATLPRPERVWVASVAGAARNQALAQAVEAAFGLIPDFYVSGRNALGVTNAYAEPARLGVDRWLGVVEGYVRHGANIVVDAGSALTVDAVDAAGRHLGGYIVPGLGMMRKSLLSGTADVRFDAPVWDGLAPGVNTAEAVDRGVLRMTVAFVTDAVVALRQQLADTCTTIVTGGDAPLLLPLLDITTQHHADLVLDGLERVTGTASED